MNALTHTYIQRDNNGKERRSYESGRKGRRKKERESDKKRRKEGGREMKENKGFGAKDDSMAAAKEFKKRPKNEVPSCGFAVRQLKKRDMLPAIVFIFSRMRECYVLIVCVHHIWFLLSVLRTCRFDNVMKTCC